MVSSGVPEETELMDASNVIAMRMTDATAMMLTNPLRDDETYGEE